MGQYGADDRRIRLSKLIEHWAEHNDEHGQRYGESAAEAESMGLREAAEEMRGARMKAVEVSKHLRNALTKIMVGG